MEMVKTASMLCAFFLVPLASAEDLAMSPLAEVPSSEVQARQCLMQKRNTMSKTGEKIKTLQDNMRDKRQHGNHKEGRHGHQGYESAASWSQAQGGNTSSDIRNASSDIANKSNSPNLHDVLPESILALGWALFKKEDVIAEVVENSILANISYAGVEMMVRMDNNEDAARRHEDGSTWFNYDLDTLGDLREESDVALNMLDLGSTYGIVTIAAMKKYVDSLRVVSVEPSPSKFFFLKWNLALNGVAEIEDSALDKVENTSGVVALNRAPDSDGQDLHFCLNPEISRTSEVCDCQLGEEHCTVVQSVTVNALTSMFGEEKIAMVRMGCQGCESKSLPALAEPPVSERVRRLAGELHQPEQSLEELACRWENGRLMSKCQHSEEDNEDNVECGLELSCPT